MECEAEEATPAPGASELHRGASPSSWVPSGSAWPLGSVLRLTWRSRAAAAPEASSPCSRGSGASRACAGKHKGEEGPGRGGEAAERGRVPMRGEKREAVRKGGGAGFRLRLKPARLAAYLYHWSLEKLLLSLTTAQTEQD